METITRKKVLLECLEALRQERNRYSMDGTGLGAAPGMLDPYAAAQAKVEIMKDVIHYLDTEDGSRGIAEWQRMEMQDPEKCRREAMAFAGETA